MTQSLSAFLRDEIALRLESGAGVADVQSALIDSSPGLSEDERAALWLFAWSYGASGRRRAAQLVLETVAG